MSFPDRRKNDGAAFQGTDPVRRYSPFVVALSAYCIIATAAVIGLSLHFADVGVMLGELVK